MTPNLESQIYAASIYNKIKEVRSQLASMVPNKTLVAMTDDHLQNAQEEIYTFLIESGYPVKVLEN